MVTVGYALSIFIACLGLLGLIAYTIEQRTKEIGIRKVLGASVIGIISLLAKDVSSQSNTSLLDVPNKFFRIERKNLA